MSPLSLFLLLLPLPLSVQDIFPDGQEIKMGKLDSDSTTQGLDSEDEHSFLTRVERVGFERS